MTICNNRVSGCQLLALIDELAGYADRDVADGRVLDLIARMKVVSDKQKGHLIVTLPASVPSPAGQLGVQ